MKSLFQLGIGSDRLHWMAQAVSPALLDATQRQALMANIAAGGARADRIDWLMGWGEANDPGLKKTLGNDADRFTVLGTRAGSLYLTVSDAYSRLLSENPADWTEFSPEEAAAASQWLSAIDEMWTIYQRHSTAPQAPGAALPARSANPAMSAITKTNYLIGGVLALGLGIAIYTIVK